MVNISEGRNKMHTQRYQQNINLWKHTREGTLLSIIIATNDRLTCYVENVCTNLPISMCVRLIYHVILYQQSPIEIIFLLLWKNTMIHLSNSLYECKYDLAYHLLNMLFKRHSLAVAYI